MNNYNALFQPLQIGSVKLKNRIAMAPMGVEYMTEADGTLNRRVVDYYLERARGGAGMLICSTFKVENRVERHEESSPIIRESSLNYLGELCDAAHSLGCRVFVQLSAGFGRVTFPEVLRGPCRSASDNTNFWDPSITCDPLTVPEIQEIVRAMGETARLLELAGVDGIELHGHEGYLFDEFTTPLWNRREDEYGGSLDNRLRFPVECLQEIRRQTGNRLAVVYRFGLKHYLKSPRDAALPGETYTEAGRDIPEGLIMAEKMEQAGFDALHVDAGCYESHYWPHPPIYQKHGCMTDMAARTKKHVSIPVIGVGRLDDPDVARNAVEQGELDIAAIGRGLLADPRWADKLHYESPRDIRPCIGCYEGCFQAYSRLKPISCAVNPASGREQSYRLEPAARVRRIMVVGGGVAGMEAARTAALRGHEVTLYEKEESLGGTVRQAAVPDFKEDLRRLLDWYKRQMKQTGITVKTGSRVTLDTIGAEKPDALILATGASPVLPRLPGTEEAAVTTVVDMLKGKEAPDGRTMIIGGGLTGCEAALWLKDRGKDAVLVEMCPELMSGGATVPFQVRLMTLNLLKQAGVEIHTGCRVEKLTAEGAEIVDSGGKTKEIRADLTAFSVGMAPVTELTDAAGELEVPVYSIGDCRQPKNVMNAVWDACEVARFL